MCSKPKEDRLSDMENLNAIEELESKSEPEKDKSSARAEGSETSSEESTSTDESEDEETATAPYSNNLEYDFHLSLSKPNIKNRIEKNKCFQLIASKTRFELLQLDALIRPSTYELLQFAAKCLENSHQNESKDILPKSWKMLTTASNSENGYFGIAFINIMKIQVVIAHRGSENTNKEPYKTHLQAIYERYHKQVHSAVTFAYEVIKELEEFKGKLPARFQLFFTGHGLGGWLAQIAAFSAQYLVRISDKFLRRENADDGYLVHTEVFDSVGCEDMLLKLVDDLDIRISDKKFDLNNLDITNFVVSPNVVNCFNKHIGNVVLISKPDSHNFSLTDQYYQDSSSLQLILEYLSSSHDMMVVIDWPVNDVSPVGDECKTLLIPQFKWLDNCAIPNTKTKAFVCAQKKCEGFFPVRYQTKPFKENTCNLSVFTLPEHKFLKNFQWIRGVPKYFKPFTLFKHILEQDKIDPNYVLEQLQYLEIKSDKVKSLCDSGRHLGQLVSFVKRLLAFYPKLKEEAEKSLKFHEVQKFAFKNESIEYSKKLEKMTDCFSKKCGLSKDVKKFVKTDLQTLQIRTSNDCDTYVVAAMINKLLKSHDHYLLLRLQNVLALNKSVSLKEVLMSEAFGKVLLVLDCNVNPVNSDEDEVKEFFKKLVKVLINPKVKPNVKLIIISEIRSDITIYLEKLTKKKLKDAPKIVDFEGFKWTDLTSNAQEMLLSKNMVIFQGSDEEISLKHLLHENDVIQDIIDNSTIISLMKDRLIQIGNQIPDLGKITSSYVPRVFLLEFEVNDNVLLNRENTRDIIAISGINYYHLVPFGVKKDFVQKCDEGHFNIERGRIFILGNNEREHFSQLVEQVATSKNAKNVHWLTLESNILKWKETHGSVDYIRQNLNHNELVVTVFDKLYDYMDITKTYNWKESEIENVRNRIKSLVISDTAGMGKTTALTSLSLQIKSNNQSLWVVRINLNDCTEVFKEVCKDFDLKKFGKPKVSNAVDFLIDKIMNCNDNTELATTLDKNLFKRKLVDSGDVVLLFDAFDEICPNYESVFIELLSILMKTKVTNIFVTSRPFSRDQIEMVLKTYCFVMRGFTMEDQVKFLVNTWLENANNETSYDLTNKAKKLIDVFRISIHDNIFADEETKFTGVLLQCLLLAEVYEDTDISNISDKISLVSLYEAFEQKKIEFYEKEKLTSTRGNISLDNNEKLAIRQLTQFHGQLAIELLYQIEDSAPIEMQDFEPVTKKILEEIALKVGLVVRVKTRIQFVHRTFAEFFVAKFLINVLEKPRINESIVIAIMTEILIEGRYNIVRAFLNEYLKNLTDYSSVVEHFSVAFSKLFQGISNHSYWSSDINEKTALHVTMDYNLKEIFKFLVDCCLNKPEAETLVHFINAVNQDFETSTVHSLKNNNSDREELLDYLLGKMQESSKKVQRIFLFGNMINRKYREIFMNCIEEHTGDVMKSTAFEVREKMYLTTELFDAAERGKVKDLQYILKQAGDKDTRHSLMLAVNDSTYSDSTALNIAVRNGRLESAKFLMEQVPSAVPFIFGLPYDSLLEDALFSGSEEMVQLILSRLPESSRILKNWEAIMTIIDKNQDDTLSILLDRGLETTIFVDINYIIDSLLGYAFTMGRLKILRTILSRGVDVNRCGEDSGSTVLHRSVFSKNPEGVSLVLKLGALVNAVDNNGNTPLHEAAKINEGILPRIVSLILNGGGNLNAVNHNNETPFDVALSMENIGALVALLPLQPFIVSLDYDSRKLFYAKSLKLKLGLTEEKLQSLGLEIDEGGRFILCDMEEQFDRLAIIADYFVADYLINQINDIHHEDTYVLDLMIDIIVKDEFDVVKKFFNQLLYRHEIEEEILNRIGNILHQRFLQQKHYDEENACNLSLHQLVSHYQESILEFLLNCFKDTPLFLHHLTSRNKNNQTVLYLTIKEEYIELSNIILNSLQNCTPGDRKTILEATLYQDYAIQERLKPLTKLMVNFEFLKELRKEFEKTSQTLLKLNDAAINGKLDQLKEILQEVNTEMRQILPFASEETWDFSNMFDQRTYYTALNLAVDGGYVETVAYLLEKGFPLNPPYSAERHEWEVHDSYKRKIIIPPLYNAIKNENINMIKFLIETGANINAYYSFWTALKVAVYYKSSEIVEFLLNYDKNLEDIDDCLLLASEKGYSDIISKLLNAGSNVNSKDESNFTPLHYAVSHRNVDAVSAMLEKGATINLQNSIGLFPLHIAAVQSTVEVVRLLLDKSAQVNVVNKDKDTPLHFAVRWNSSDVVACLIKEGADIEAMNAEGKTPLDIKPRIIRYKDES